MTEHRDPDPDPDSAPDATPLGYAAAVEELESILDEIEDDDVDVDLLSERVARAARLIEFCRDRILVARSAVESATGSPVGSADGEAAKDLDQ